MLRIAEKNEVATALLLRGRPYLRSSQAARVLGISQTNFFKMMWEGRYSIRFGRDGLGYKFDLEDVFRTAYPFADDMTLGLLIMEFREKCLDERKKLKKRSSGKTLDTTSQSS